ncbi:MAG TPA: hypothetical protein VF600_16575 [Abditibacteriaceae bacterium]
MRQSHGRFNGFALLLSAVLVGCLAAPARVVHAAPSAPSPKLKLSDAEIAARLEALEAAVATLQGIVTAQSAQITAQSAENAAQSAQITALLAKTAPVTVTGTDYIIRGVNVYVVDGTGDTESVSGLGNLTVGYNEPRVNATEVNVRTGSHNLILGRGNNFSSFGGAVFGVSNTISGKYSSILGGQFNTASDLFSSVLGGFRNDASGQYSSVTTGAGNNATGQYSSVTGGNGNTASGVLSSVSGGYVRTAPGNYNWRGGGLFENN